MTRSNFKVLTLAVLLMLKMSLSNAQTNLQAFTPSVLLQKGQVEYNLFNSLYSQTKTRDRNGNNIDLGERQSFFRNTFLFLYGVSDTRRLNLGVQANIVTARYTSPDNSILSIFGKETGDFKKTLLASIGPVIKFTPLKNVGFLSVQSTLLFPLSNELERPRFVDHDRVSWVTQIFFDKALNDQFRIFLEAGILYRFEKLESHTNFFRVPLSAIVSYFPSAKATVFGTLQHSPVLGEERNETQSKFGQLRWFTALGIGAKYQVTNSLGFELSYSNFVLSRNDGAGSTINIGVRIIK